MFIEDGTGTGNRVRVDNENRLVTKTVSVSLEHHINEDEGKAYNALFAVNPDGDDDCIFYLKNNDNDNLIIEGVWLSVSGAEEVYYKIGEVGTAVKTNGADIIPANMNAGSGKTANVICYSNISDGAVDITGLSGGSIIQKLWLTSASDTKFFNSETDIIIPKNKSFSIYCVGGDVLIRGTVVFVFHDVNL